ncbi:hypothetical protein MTZ49_12200 [Entomomonas sp. E2T0]|uniref:hypothetical protein n=1 Tax=Entomomonas sp. E2T0 TaxID=2930213 RepID=UPI0022281793|nr:hypothetical protein [Entomomonas sp. E2T0]UYZ83351.1 hypothetical protein MTZ49_12200 [Entomomonas sp. E2T0]
MSYDNDQELQKIIAKIKYIKTHKNVLSEEFDYKGIKIKIAVGAVVDQPWGQHEDKERREYFLMTDNEDLTEFINEEINK